MSKVAQNVAGSQERLTSHNLWSFSLGGVGRDLMYQLFNTYMLTCILLTKGVNTAEFAIVGVVIMCCRIFDALNDPIMGSIIEITRTKWGKFKPWIMIGAISNCIPNVLGTVKGYELRNFLCDYVYRMVHYVYYERY